MSKLMNLFTRTATTITLLISSVSLLAASPVQTNIPAPPTISAKNYLLWDANSGFVVAEKDIDERIDPASITKLMTSYVIADAIKSKTISLADEVLISANARGVDEKSSRMFIEVNTKVTVEDLMRGLIIQSGNDAAVALAEFVAGSEESFVDLMNQYAANLGLINTRYANSTGFTEDGHYTTARDIATLSKALIRDFPKHYEFYKEKSFTYNGIKQSNRNNLLWRDDAVDGLKTGYTKAAGYCLAASAEKNGMRLISVVLGTQSKNARITQSQTLLNYGFRFYESQKLYDIGTKILQQKVWKAEQDDIELTVKAPVYVTFPRGRYQDLSITSNIPNQIIAPISSNQALGNVVIKLDNKVLATVPLYSKSDITEGGIFKRMTDSVKLWFED